MELGYALQLLSLEAIAKDKSLRSGRKQERFVVVLTRKRCGD